MNAIQLQANMKRTYPDPIVSETPSYPRPPQPPLVAFPFFWETSLEKDESGGS